jgi:hypothetical protein
MTPTVSQITAAVAQAFDVHPSNITGPSIQRQFAYPRFAVCALSHEAGHSMPAIGARLGNRDHTSILHGIRRVGDDGLLGALNYLGARGDLKAQTVYAGGSRKIKIYEIANQAVEVAA